MAVIRTASKAEAFDAVQELLARYGGLDVGEHGARGAPADGADAERAQRRIRRVLRQDGAADG
jgi:hypothetical protein